MPAPESFPLRVATVTDIPALNALMNECIRELLKPFLSPVQIEASYSLMGLDTQLIEDGTYFVIEADGAIMACGGWGRRSTLFGGDHSAGRDAALLDPMKDAARVRAMYTSPAFARRGIGRRMLETCERAAANEGFARVELAATLAGEPLYRACGYSELFRRDVYSPTGIAVPMIIMGKELTRSQSN